MCELLEISAYRSIKLRDGRLLGYLDCGNSAGQPLLYFHAFRFSKFGRLPHEIAKTLGIRLIAPDRPGFGLSDFKPGRTIRDWASDVAELADTLQLKRFAVLGHSGGGPFAAACAHELPHRITRAAMVSSVGLHDWPDEANQTVRPIPRSYRLGRSVLAWATWAYLKLSGRLGHSSRLLALAGGPSIALFSVPQELTQFVNGIGVRASRSQRYGAVWELMLYTRPWGFQFQDIAVEFQIWHGEADSASPITLMRHIAKVIPNCQTRFLPNEDHFSVTASNMSEILAALFT